MIAEIVTDEWVQKWKLSRRSSPSGPPTGVWRRFPCRRPWRSATPSSTSRLSSGRASRPSRTAR
eukprot:1599142-Prymnesium_polylepis.2